MNFDFRNSEFHQQTVVLNRSKSLYIRYLFANFIKYGEVLPVGDEEVEDVKVSAKALETIKKRTDFSQTTFVDLGDCGTAFRFMVALLSVTHGRWLLTGSARLLARPILPLVESLRAAGASIVQVKTGLLIKGTHFKAESLQINCSLSSQFASAILLIGDLIGLKKLDIVPKEIPSLPYLIMTKEIVKRIKDQNHVLSLNEIESDWSGALFWYAMCSLKAGSSFILKNLTLDSLQGDSIIYQWFNKLDVESTVQGKDIFIRHQVSQVDTQEVLSFDLLPHPDLAPVLAVLLLLKEREATLRGLQNLNLKESNRFDLLLEILHLYAEVTQIDTHTLAINHAKAPKAQRLSFCSHQDHRFVMAFLLFAVYNDVEIDDVSYLGKSYQLLERYLSVIS